MLNSLTDLTAAGGSLGIPGLCVTGDPGAADWAAQTGSLSLSLGTGWAKSLSFATGQCPVMKYTTRHPKAGPRFAVQGEQTLAGVTARGLFRSSYATETQRGHLTLARPASGARDINCGADSGTPNRSDATAGRSRETAVKASRDPKLPPRITVAICAVEIPGDYASLRSSNRGMW